MEHGRSHLHAFQAHAGSRVIAVADRKNERDVVISPSATIKGFAWLPSLRRVDSLFAPYAIILVGVPPRCEPVLTRLAVFAVSAETIWARR